MVAPVSGPFNKSETRYWFNPWFGWDSPRSYTTRRWFRQAKPYNLRLDYDFTDARMLAQDGYGNTTPDIAFRVGPPAYQTQALYNAAYAIFIDKINATKAELGATLGEWKSSSSMIQYRANQLFNGYKAAKRGDLSGLKRAWGKHAGLRPRLRAAGGHVLEYSFGWAPLVSDINSALEVLHNRLPTHQVTGCLRIRGSGSLVEDYGSVSCVSKGSWEYGVCLRADVKVTNPNTLLAQQLGLVNLGSVAWELTPNSYIVDYFFNVGQFIDSFTDLVGLELGRESNTVFRKQNNASAYHLNPGYTAESWWVPHTFSAERVDVTRRGGIPRPSLSLNLPWTMSMQRASTSVARLLQLLKGK